MSKKTCDIVFLKGAIFLWFALLALMIYEIESILGCYSGIFRLFILVSELKRERVLFDLLILMVVHLNSLLNSKPFLL